MGITYEGNDDKWWGEESNVIGFTGDKKGGKKSGTQKSFGFDKNYTPCHHSHKELKLGNGVIIGASCGNPRPGYDIYIGFDSYMTFQHRKYPWEQSDSPVIEFLYNIVDGQAPKDKENFRKMIEWVCNQLQLGKKIHAGCIGGHGRTGTFLAALVSVMLSEKDAITWVRANHCKKAVESASQVAFLNKHYGITKQEGTKEGIKASLIGNYDSAGTAKGKKGQGSASTVGSDMNVVAVKCGMTIW